MKKNQEFFIGLITIAGIIFALNRADKVVDFLILSSLYCFVIFLWQRKSIASKFFAVILLPQFMFIIFLPKRTKDIIKKIEEIDKARSESRVD